MCWPPAGAPIANAGNTLPPGGESCAWKVQYLFSWQIFYSHDKKRLLCWLEALSTPPLPWRHMGVSNHGQFERLFNSLYKLTSAKEEGPNLSFCEGNPPMTIVTSLYCPRYVIMSAIASQITSVSIVYSTVCSGSDQRKHQSSASLAFVREIHRWPISATYLGSLALWVWAQPMRGDVTL